MNSVFFDPLFSDEERRNRIYSGQLVVSSARKSTQAFIEFADSLIRNAFHPYDPREAQHSIPVEQYAGILAKLKPVFAANGTVTAGNSSQMSDGAGAVVLVSEDALKRFNLTPIGRFLGYSVAGVPPEIMGIGPVKAVPKVLKQVGLKQDDLEWIELNAT